MTGLTPRASLLVARLLTSAGTASAEGAWVLWQPDQTPIEGRPDRMRHDWHPAGAAGTEARGDAWSKPWAAEDKTKNRVYASDKGTLMGGALQRVYKWPPNRTSREAGP